MPYVARCKLCGRDHRYTEYVDQMDCEECGSPLSSDNVRVVRVLQSNAPADPLEGT